MIIVPGLVLRYTLGWALERPTHWVVTMHETTETTRTDLTVKAYVRPTVLSDPIDETLARLERLDESGRIDAVEIRTWPAEVPVDSPRSDPSVLDVYRTFVVWAERADASIDPPFTARTKHSRTTDETRTVLSTPVLSLAVYEDETLRAVYPHEDETGIHTVGQAVDAIAHANPPIVGETTEDAPASLDAGDRGPVCPHCRATTANVHGLDACVDCAWVDATRDAIEWSTTAPPDSVPKP